MAKTTLRLDTRRALADGTYPIQIVVGLGTNIYLSTGLYSNKSDWDTRAKMYTGRGARKVNAILTSMLTTIINRILSLKETGQWNKLTKKQVREMLTDLDLEKPTADTPTLGEVFTMMLDGRRENTKSIAKNTINKLNAFCGDVNKVHFDDITASWLEDFYKSMPDMSINTKACYFRLLRRAVNYALEREYTTRNAFRSFRVPTEETRMRNLPIEKMRVLAHLETVGRYTEYRDMFLLTFYLIGINTVDLSELTKDNIVDGRLEYRRAKTGKLYSIKIEPEAQEILDRYAGKHKLLQMFERCKNYKDYQGTMNNALQRIGAWAKDKDDNYICAGNGKRRMQPLEKQLSIYWARYSWATYAADLDIPKDTISEALGHSYGAKVTGVYIKFSRDKIDAANRRVIDYVLQK